MNKKMRKLCDAADEIIGGLQVSKEKEIQTWEEKERLLKRQARYSEAQDRVYEQIGRMFVPVTFPKSEQTTAVKTLRRMECGECKIITGETGAGKTHAAVGFFYRAWVVWKSKVQYISALEFNALFGGYNINLEKLYSYAFAPVIIFDELGSENLTDWFKERFMLFVDKVYTNQATFVILSNLVGEKKVVKIGHPRLGSTLQIFKERYGERVVSRFMGWPGFEVVFVEKDLRVAKYLENQRR